MTHAATSDPRLPTLEAEHARTATEYLRGLAALAAEVDADAVGAFVARVTGALSAGRTVFIAGNGGSAAAATHMACDWGATWRVAGNRSARIISLADNSAVITALANDLDFTEVFSRQLVLMGEPGDLLVLLSVSGRSANLVAAARTARAGAIEVAALLGDSGLVAPYCDVVVDLRNDDYGFTEDLHLAINHIVVRALNGGRPLGPRRGTDHAASRQPA